MTAVRAVGTRLARGGGRLGSRLGRFWSGISAVSIKELRGRMRGRRAFVVLTIYLLLLSLFSFAIYVYLKQQAGQLGIGDPFGRDGMPFPGSPTLSNGTALSAGIGHGIFGGLLLLETLLVLVLAPAFTTGAISLEREKQTIDMLVTTPLSTLGMVVGKLFSALTYIFLLIIASIPLASLVFVFGGVGPEDLVRGYAFLFALAFGMGAVGLFISALVRRTQTATVVTFVVVLVLSIGTAGVHQFWQVATRPASSGSLIVSQRSGGAPEAVLWLNPFVADLDMICATTPDTYHHACAYISGVTRRPYFGSPATTPPGRFEPGGPIFERPAVDQLLRSNGGGDVFVLPEGVVPPQPEPGRTNDAVDFGFPRDTFWPKSAASFVVLGLLLTVLSTQLVSPTRRLRLRTVPLPRFRRPRRDVPPAGEPPSDPPLDPTVDSTEARA